MDLDEPLRTVTPSLDATVLQVLARVEDPRTAYEIHRACGSGSRSGVRLVLRRLAADGLVEHEVFGGRHVFALNREHLLAGPVIAAAMARFELEMRLQRRVEAWRPAPRSACITAFGPDLHLLLVLDGGHTGDQPHVPEVFEAGCHRLCADVLTWTGTRCAITVITGAELRARLEADDPVAVGWLERPVRLCGSDLLDVAGEPGRHARARRYVRELLAAAAQPT